MCGKIRFLLRVTNAHGFGFFFNCELYWLHEHCTFLVPFIFIFIFFSSFLMLCVCVFFCFYFPSTSSNCILRSISCVLVFRVHRVDDFMLLLLLLFNYVHKSFHSISHFMCNRIVSTLSSDLNRMQRKMHFSNEINGRNLVALLLLYFCSPFHFEEKHLCHTMWCLFLCSNRHFTMSQNGNPLENRSNSGVQTQLYQFTSKCQIEGH